jgi:hypothetical protein
VKRRTAAVLAIFVSFAGVAASAGAGGDPIAAEIARWQVRIHTAPEVDPETKPIRDGSLPLLDAAEKAAAQGRRWFALSRLAYVWPNLGAADFADAKPKAMHAKMTALEREWQRTGTELAAVRTGAEAPSFDGTPAAARAVAETALSEVDGYYASSLDYGRNTAPEYGLFYLGAAVADLELTRFAASLRSFPAAAAAPPPALRSVAPEIERLQGELIDAYVPPASIDNHPVFIRISALLKQARELDAAGRYFGALSKLLDARMRLSRLQHPDRKLDLAATAARAVDAERRLAATGVDASIASTYVEIALVQAGDPDPAQMGPETAAAVFDDVVPLYLEALGPAPPIPPERKAEATVTLVRWPYT